MLHMFHLSLRVTWSQIRLDLSPGVSKLDEFQFVFDVSRLRLGFLFGGSSCFDGRLARALQNFIKWNLDLKKYEIGLNRSGSAWFCCLVKTDTIQRAVRLILRKWRNILKCNGKALVGSSSEFPSVGFESLLELAFEANVTSSYSSSVQMLCDCHLLDKNFFAPLALQCGHVLPKLLPAHNTCIHGRPNQVM